MKLFHRYLEELQKRCENIYIISECEEVGHWP